ncbi:vesicular, overexpressed in cancer, prosurvival protein 1-like [Mytilus californianus]|uniref:vesicular, overexpressed in cancer, prosurvival protein 1-like n=1 Tax=Mytilus californianus TaxID=6549 RepID=UPI0022459E91|nr:vesicular, overexpressed in cancer, prosurvival protein 1-like [Mytilus californianus]
MATDLMFWVSFAHFLIDLVEGYYCDSERCLENEYCCGDNICCVSYTVWELWYFWCGIIFFLVLLSMCICLWKTRYRDSRIFIGTSQPIYSPLSNKQPSLAHGERYRDDYTEGEYYRTPPPSGVYGYKTTVPPTYDDVVNNYKEDHKK